MLDNGQPERFPLEGIFGRLVQRPLCHSHRRGRHPRPCAVKRAHGDQEPGSLAAENILLGHHDIFKRDPPRVAGSLAHVPLLPSHRDARRVPVHDERCAGARGRGIFVRPRQHEIPVGVAASSDPHLAAVDNVLVPLLLCRRLDPEHVRPGPWFRDAVGGYQRFLRQTSLCLKIRVRKKTFLKLSWL